MRNYSKHLPVNWIDGMKINKTHFIAQDNAWSDSLQDIGSLNTSPVRFGILPPSFAEEDNFNVKISVDNQNVLRVSVLSCKAITQGGCKIDIQDSNNFVNGSTDGLPVKSFSFPESRSESIWWVVLLMNPFEKLPAGSPDLSENPPRFPYVLPAYSIEVVNEKEFSQYVSHPYAITVGKLYSTAYLVKVDTDFIPPCYSISASPDMMNLLTEFDQFMSRLEILCALIVQKIYQKNQQNDISELVQFLCDRIMLYLGQVITDLRWKMAYESPIALFACLAGLGRVMKNSIDLRIGSGKEEMMNYLVEWCQLKPGELEIMLSDLANIRFDNNDINGIIQKVSPFVKVTTTLFEALHKADFIGKREQTGIFIKENKVSAIEITEVKSQRRRFLGGKTEK